MDHLKPKARENWLCNNLGKIMPLYEIMPIDVWPLVATSSNIINSFKMPIYVQITDVFTDNDFAPSFVTDCPIYDDIMPQETSNEPHPETLDIDHPQPRLLDQRKPQDKFKWRAFQEDEVSPGVTKMMKITVSGDA